MSRRTRFAALAVFAASAALVLSGMQWQLFAGILVRRRRARPGFCRHA